MNVEIGTEAAQFPEKEYMNGIFLAVCKSERIREKNSQLMSYLQCPVYEVLQGHYYYYGVYSLGAVISRFFHMKIGPLSFSVRGYALRIKKNFTSYYRLTLSSVQLIKMNNPPSSEIIKIHYDLKGKSIWTKESTLTRKKLTLKFYKTNREKRYCQLKTFQR